MRSNLENRLSSLETKKPPKKSDTERFLEKLMDDELNQLEKIAKKKETGREPTPDEYAFLDELEAKYEFVRETD